MDYKVGDKVAIVWMHWDARTVNESVIEKVYKNGNVVIKGQEGQWKPYSYCKSFGRTGKLYYRSNTVVRLWDEEFEKENNAYLKKRQLKDRARKALEFFKGLSEKTMTEEMIDVLEKAAAAVQDLIDEEKMRSERD